MTQHANGGASVPLPPIDPGNTFVLVRPRPDVYGEDLMVMTTDIVGAPDPVWQTAHPATMSDGTKVLVITWRVGPATLTARVDRPGSVKLGRDLIAAGREVPAALTITGPAAQVEQRVVEVQVELDGCGVRMRWTAEDCEKLGTSLVQAANGLSGLVLPGSASGIHP
jgi:hypothetical protein